MALPCPNQTKLTQKNADQVVGVVSIVSLHSVLLWFLQRIYELYDKYDDDHAVFYK